MILAVKKNLKEEVKILCDHGALESLFQYTSDGTPMLMYAATLGHHEIAMFLSLKVQNVDAVQERLGLNAFSVYLK